MKRFVRRILFFLILGIITTVAVAWFFAAFVRPQDSDSMSKSDIVRLSDRWDLSWHCLTRLGSSINYLCFSKTWKEFPTHKDRANLPTWISGFADQNLRLWKGPPKGHSCTLRGNGWPIESMWSDIEGTGLATEVLVGGIQLATDEPGPTGTNRALPFYIIPSGFTIDTTFYAALWLTLLTGLSFTHRRWRMHKGRCEVCGYDLRGNGNATQQCPECGSTMVVRKKAIEA